MDMTEKNGQPSMEEILASIRRIIAEEPADAISLDFRPRSGPVPGQGAEHLDLEDASDFELPSMFRAPAAAMAERSANQPAKLMDALRATPQTQLPAGDPARDYGFGEFPVALLQPASDMVSGGNQGLSSLKPAARLEARPSDADGYAAGVFPLPSAVEIPVQNQLQAPLQPEPLAREAAEPAVAVAGHEQTYQAATPDDASQPIVRQMVQFRDQRFTGMGGGSAPSAAIIPASEPATPAVAATSAPVVAVVEPVTAPIAISPGPQSADAAVFAAPLVAPPSFATLAAKSMVFSVQQPASTLPPMQIPVAAQVANTVPTLAAEPIAAPVATPAPMAALGGGIEDATAELLRPMLRQWLSDNMPRMVEKALHIEVAESLKPAKKPV